MATTMDHAVMAAAGVAGGLLLRAALANLKAVAPYDYFSYPGSIFIPWALYYSWDDVPAIVKLPVAVAVGGMFLGYNFTRRSRFCD
jgi:hypothetical protein